MVFHSLHYLTPAHRWTDASPIGNGTLGAMCFGGVKRDRVQINDDRCWSGSPASIAGSKPPSRRDGPTVLQQVREAMAAGAVERAEGLSRGWQSGHAQAYQMLVDLWLDSQGTERFSAYRRELDLATGIAASEWCDSGSHVNQEVYSSYPDQALLVHRWAPQGSRFNVTISMTSPHPLLHHAVSDTGIELILRMPSDVLPPHEEAETPVVYDSGPSSSVAIVAKVVTDGKVSAQPGGFEVSGATDVVVYLTTATDAPDVATDLNVLPHGDVHRLLREADQAASRVSVKGLAAVRKAHIEDHGSLFSRLELDLGDGSMDAVPTDERLRRALSAPDPGLAALVFAFGRYLMIAGSRPGTLPMNLQGIWNEHVRPVWSSNYTTNINMPMNYWLAEPGNLAECAQPLHSWMERLARSGSQVAKELYGADGWVAHHNSDRWGFALPAGEGTADPSWSTWPLAGVWLSLHLYEHWAFTRDDDFMRSTAWPILAGACRFALDWLVPDSNGRLATVPSTSPENKYLLPSGRPVALSTSTTSDVSLIRGLFSHTVEVMTEVGLRDRALHQQLLDALDRLPTLSIRPDGLVSEWPSDPPEQDPKHRHQSHLIGVYPGDLITPQDTPEWAEAARKSLAVRGPRSTGWSLAWRIGLHARLQNPRQAAETIRAFLAPMAEDASDEVSMTAPAGVYKNLFCAHPPFQVDGNLGFTAGVIELLLQSHRGDVHVLPCLPPDWVSGAVRGLRARGGLTVDIGWSNGTLDWVTLIPDSDRAADVTYGERQTTVTLRQGEPLTLDSRLRPSTT